MAAEGWDGCWRLEYSWTQRSEGKKPTLSGAEGRVMCRPWCMWGEGRGKKDDFMCLASEYGAWSPDTGHTSFLMLIAIWFCNIFHFLFIIYFFTISLFNIKAKHHWFTVISSHSKQSQRTFMFSLGPMVICDVSCKVMLCKWVAVACSQYLHTLVFRKEVNTCKYVNVCSEGLGEDNAYNHNFSAS